MIIERDLPIKMDDGVVLRGDVYRPDTKERVPIIMAGSHKKAGEYVAKLLYIAARRRWREARTMVAEVMMIRRSGRRLTSCFK